MKLNRCRAIRLSLLFLLVMLFRNNGFYIILVLLPFMLFTLRKDKRQLGKMAAVILIPLVIFKVGIGMILLPSLNIPEGSPREMLSVPLQQTARYIRDHGDEITDEEKEDILAVLSTESGSLDEIADAYVPGKSDNVKGRFYNKYATSEDLREYFLTWVRQFKKHPATYIQAFFNLNYGWFGYDEGFYDPYHHGITDEALALLMPDLRMPEKLAVVRSAANMAVPLLRIIPITSWIPRVASYIWACLMLFFVMLIRKNKAAILASAPLFLNQLIYFLGPVVIMRYCLPLMFCMPFMIFITFRKRDHGHIIDESEREPA